MAARFQGPRPGEGFVRPKRPDDRRMRSTAMVEWAAFRPRRARARGRILGPGLGCGLGAGERTGRARAAVGRFRPKQ